MPKITLNGRELPFEKGQTVIQVALASGTTVPHYCWHPALSVVASCRICQVEVHGPGPRRLATACNLECVDGMVVETDTAAVTKARAGNLEDLLLNHPLDCPICDKAGECWLQDYAYEYGASTGRNDFERRRLKKREPISDKIVLDQERCILCTRCVRFMDEFAKKPELVVENRGEKSVIDIFPGHPLSSQYQGNLADICPVGALTLSSFRFKNRVWWLKEVDSVCPSCSRGCSITLDVRQNEVNRVRPRTNPQVNGHFICDVGRFGLLDEYHRQDRIVQIRADGAETTAEDAAGKIAAGLAAAAETGKNVLVLASTQTTCEELYLLKETFERAAGKVGERATLAFQEPPKSAPDGILRTGEDAANVQGLLKLGFQRMGADEIAKRLKSAGAAWILDGRVAARDLPPFTALTAVASPLAERAHVVVPGTTVGEKDGTLVNFEGMVQRVRPALKPPRGVPHEFAFLLQVAERLGATDMPRSPADAFLDWADRHLGGDLTLASLPAHGAPLEKTARGQEAAT